MIEADVKNREALHTNGDIQSHTYSDVILASLIKPCQLLLLNSEMHVTTIINSIHFRPTVITLTALDAFISIYLIVSSGMVFVCRHITNKGGFFYGHGKR